MNTPIKILHLEDCEPDHALIKDLLSQEGLKCELTRIQSRPELFTSLEQNQYDLILADSVLPKFNGPDALEIVKALKPDLPFIFVSGTIDEETAIESLRNGATDYVLKHRLTRLVPAVQRALLEAEEKKLRREIERSLRQTRRLEALGTLTEGLAHDFNNILMIIMGHASLLNQVEGQPEQVRDIAATIDQASRRGAEIIQQLLAFTRKSEGLLSLTNLNHQVEETLSMVRGTLPRNVELVTDLAADLPKINGDPIAIERGLINLISNARDAMPEGGRMTVSTRLVNDWEVTPAVSKRISKQYVRLLIADTGVGMDEETRLHIFEPFYTTKPVGVGTGLGLPVVYGLMKSHNGVIDIQSELGKGTTVSLFFPIVGNRPVPAQAHKKSSRLSALGTEGVMVVEDEPEVANYLNSTLRAHGYRCFVAQTPQEAIALAQSNSDKIKLVVLDIGLPGMDGFDLSIQLKTLIPKLKVIVASGYTYPDIHSKVAEFGLQTYLAKPYQSHELLNAIRTVLHPSAGWEKRKTRRIRFS